MSGESQPNQLRSAMDRAFLTNDEEAGELILVRHGQQLYPSTSAPFAWVDDPPLSDTGRRQAQRVGQHLSDEQIEAVYTSGLQRAAQTGRAIAAYHDIETVVVPELREVAVFRDLEHRRTPLEALGASALQAIQTNFVAGRRWDAYPLSESSDAFRERAREAVEAIITAHPAQTIVVACHGGVINAYLSELLKVPEDMFFRPAHASVHRLLHKGDRRVVLTLNEMHFLAESDGLLTF
jgi:2,3-bisphosphoglycerate-dependent phosphoglycerate mutase